MSRFNTGNPIGSADPRDRDDNSKNLDEAVNDLNSETWIDRFGVERITIQGALNRLNEIIIAGGQIFESEEAGRDAVQDGQYYYVVSDDPDVSKSLYKRLSESESQWIADDPSAALVRSLGLFVDAQSDIRQELLNTLSGADRACAFDFTNRRTFGLDTDTQTRVEQVLPIVGDIGLTGGAEPPTLLTQSNGLTGVGQPDGTSDRQRLFSETPLIQGYPCTLVLSQQTDAIGSARSIFWQRGSGGDGNIQITSNRRIDDGSITTFLSVGSVFIQGSVFPDGSNSCNFNWTLGRGNALALVLRDPSEDSELWVNGLLVSTFTAPPQILQESSYLMGDPGAISTADGVIVGRCIAVDAALSGDDLRRAGEWVAQGLGQSWLSPVVTVDQVQTPATCAAIYHLPKSSVGDGDATKLSNARLLYAKNPTLRLRPASTIKTLTSLVAERNIDNLDQLFTVTSDDIAGGSGNNLLEGDQITARDALYNLMVASSNTTANLIARSVGQIILDSESVSGDPYDRFILEMNSVAETIGMHASVISNPSGLNVGVTRSNAEDLAKLLVASISAPLTNGILKARSHSLAVIGDNARIEDVALNVDLPMYDDIVHRKGGNLIGSFGEVNTYLASFQAPNGDLIVGTMLWEDSPSEISSASDTLYALVKAVEKEVRWPALDKPINQRLINPVSVDERIGNLVRGYDSNLFDFTNPRAYVTNGEVGSGFRIKHLASLTSNRVLRQSREVSIASNEKGSLVAKQQEGASGLVSETPLVTQLPCTLAFSLKADSSDPIYAFFQSASGEEGRIQILLNGEYDGSILATTPDKLQVFVGGATGGSGLDGQPIAAEAPRGQSAVGIVILRDPSESSEIWVNGTLVDTFTMPSTIYQGQSELIRNISPAGIEASYSRFVTLDRAISPSEVPVLGEWLASSYGEKWSGRPLTDSGLLAAEGAIVYRESDKPVRVGEYPESTILYEKGPTVQLLQASLTKVMTSMVMLDYVSDLDGTMTVLASDATGGSGNNLNADDVISYREALYNMMLPSSNVTTTVVARTVGEIILDGEPGDPIEAFVEQMNVKSANLNMTETVFLNASGLNTSGQVTCARDMGRMGLAALSYSAIVNTWGAVTHDLVITGPSSRTITIEHSAQNMGDNDILGGKTGTLGSSARNLLEYVALPGGERAVAVVMLTGEDTRYNDMSNLLDYVGKQYRWPSGVE